MKLLALFVFLFVFSSINQAFQPQNYLLLSPQFKLGKIENGPSFAEIQFMRLNWCIDKKVSIEAGLSTGYTAPRDGSAPMNHALNRLGIKVIYRPIEHLGFFAEGNYSQRIPGATNDVSSLVYDNFQAVGVQLDIARFEFK